MRTKTDQDQATEDRIFDAARDVFYEQGFDGARMQEIARRAGINHSMLHYYFRSKGRLFDAVFHRAVMKFFPAVLKALRSDTPVLEKLEAFVDTYLDMIRANPHMPAFILEELRRRPSTLRKIAGLTAGQVFGGLRKEIDEAVRAGRIRAVRAEDLFANLVGMCVFPFLARPMLQTVFDMKDDGYDAFLAERAVAVKAFLRGALKP